MSLYRRAGAVGVSAALAVGLAACSDSKSTGAQSQPAPTAWSAEHAANGADKDGEQMSSRFKVVPADPLELKLESDKSALVDTASWPDVRELLGADLLSGMFPPSSPNGPQFCSFGTLGGKLTPKNTTCKYQVDGNENDDDSSRMSFTLKGVGADSEVVKAWDADRQTARAANNSNDVFYKDGTYGARRVMWKGAGSAPVGSFVVSDGQVAMWFEVTYFGDHKYLTASEPATVLRQSSFQVLVKDLVPLLPRAH